MIVEIENYDGETIGSVHIREIYNEVKVLDIDGCLDLADIDFDDIYDTNEKKVRLQINRRDLNDK